LSAKDAAGFGMTAPRQLQSLSRIDAIEHAWEGDDLANVLGSTNPRDGAFEAQTKARMRDAAVAAQVEVPLERVLGEIVLSNAPEESFVVRLALAAQ